MGLKFENMWDYSDPVTSENKFYREIYHQGDNAFTVWELQTQIASALRLQRKFDDSEKILNSIQAGIEFAPNTYEKIIVGALYNLEMGRLLLDIGKTEAAYRYFGFALIMSIITSIDKLMIDAVEMLATATFTDESTNSYLKKIERLTDSSLSTDKMLMASYALIVGLKYLAHFESQRAIEQFMHARDIFSKCNKAELTRFARLNICKVQRFLGQHKTALLELRTQEQLLKKENRVDGYVLEEIAENLLALGHDSAQIYFSKAFQDLEIRTLLHYREPTRLARLHALGVN